MELQISEGIRQHQKQLRGSPGFPQECDGLGPAGCAPTPDPSVERSRLESRYGLQAQTLRTQWFQNTPD